MGDWLPALRRYVAVTAVGHLLWEALQLPLYTIWRQATRGEIAFALLHCTAGDVLVALASLTGALILAGTPRFPWERFPAIALLTVFLGVGYTVYSEWINVNVQASWTYAPAMPTLPPLGTGLTPVLQWLVIPALALAAARHVPGRGPGGS